ncbi:hypothetical protein A9Q95_10335 [Rhodobacterales bacterium 59_46_T64]|nr:hypothetical protein A9Q95_10335 [Rhodobacterales bacterium 59_46_T64]
MAWLGDGFMTVLGAVARRFPAGTGGGNTLILRLIDWDVQRRLGALAAVADPRSGPGIPPLGRSGALG